MKAVYSIKRREPVTRIQWPAELHPVLRRVYSRRPLHSAAEVEHGLERLHTLDSLGGLDRAVQILSRAIREGRRIMIVGDFDADGATSAVVAVRALRAMGAGCVDYLVPDRFRFGYGLTPEIVEVAAQRQPDLLVTVDNGIASNEGVEAARARGMQVIVTDHHLPGARLPPADAIVNPNLPDSTFPSKCLAGVGVIFYVMLGLRSTLREQNRLENTPNMAQLLDLVALGTVADVVPLDHNNRILVEQGLRRIRAGQCVPGISALLTVGKRNPRDCSAADLGFAVAPRLNAAGRLEDMSQGIECLLSDDPDRAAALAARLDELNSQRREIEADMRGQAEAIIRELSARLDTGRQPAGLCLYDRRWHQGVIGIVAARIKEQVHRPVIAFARTSDGELKGSARSVSGLHVRDVLDSVATAHPGLITRFGGHAMAAGLSIAENKLPAFRDAFAESVASQLGAAAAGRAVIWSDGELAPDEMDLGTAEALRAAGPWGQGFPEPLFDGVFELQNKRVVGQNHLKVEVCPEGSSNVLDGIAFNETGESLNGCRRVRLAYRLEVNEFRNRRNVQLNIQYLEPAG